MAMRQPVNKLQIIQVVRFDSQVMDDFVVVIFLKQQGR